MSIFDLHATVLADYRDFVRSFFIVADKRARQFVEHALVEEARLWPDFLLQVSPAYARATTVDELAAQSVLHETTARIFRTAARSTVTTSISPTAAERWLPVAVVCEAAAPGSGQSKPCCRLRRVTGASTAYALGQSIEQVIQHTDFRTQLPLRGTSPVRCSWGRHLTQRSAVNGCGALAADSGR